jgi:hypothetical protein
MIDHNKELFVPGKIRTYTGKYFNAFDPDQALICIEDIPHALSQLPRFGGHLPHFYSVAQHSLYVSRILPKHLKLCGLLHDATEAYLGGDIPSPFKEQLPGYKEAEHYLLDHIFTKFDVVKTYHSNYEVIKEADTKALKIEWDVLMMDREHSDPYFTPAKDWYVHPERVEATFIRNFNKLYYDGKD